MRVRVERAGALNMVGALVLLVLVAVIALRAVGTPPPSIAEFAPQAQQIREAPAEQQPTKGGGIGIAAPSPSPLAPSPNAAPPQAILLHCVGDPPRQIEDPQSPPCVPYWQGNNGGATNSGVSGSTVNVAWVFQGTCGSNTQQNEADALERFFNERFELYSRRIHLICVNGGNGDDPSMRSAADGIAAQGVFASGQYTDEGGLAYNQELAAKGVVSAMGFEANPTEPQLAQFDPYIWSYMTAGDRILATMGAWYCAELNGHNAAHAGPAVKTEPRKLGVIYYPWDPGQKTPMASLDDALRVCGVTPVFYDDTDSNNSAAATIIAMQQAHVTSIFCVCEYAYWATQLAKVASGQAYYPEWLMSSWGGGDTQFTFHFWSAEQTQAQDTFGLSFQPKQVTLQNDPMWWAWGEGSRGTTQPRELIDIYQGHLLYRSLLEIMSGIQMAGPHLTPRSFAAGLHAAAFPNPDTPIYAGHVGFEGSSHAMTVDAAEWWYSPTAQSPWIGDVAGAICYVNHGARIALGGFRPGRPDLLFSQPCDSGV